MSTKSKPIKKSHTEFHGVARKSNKKTWMLISGILAIALIISIFTNGFYFNNLKLAENILKKESQKITNSEAKSKLNNALESLSSAISLIESEKKSSTSSTYTGKKVKLEFYVMSQCPYGIQVENAVKPVLDKLGDAVDFSINFIATDLGNGQFQSLHGQNEVLGNIVQLCAMKYEPKKYMDLIVCMNKNAAQIPDNWESCARENGLNVDKIKSCYVGDEGKQLHSESIKKSETVKATGSPTMYINGKQYNGGRDTTSFFRALCAEIPDHKACSEIPKPKDVNLIIINDKQCAQCQQYNSLADQLKSLFPGLKTKILDYEEQEGQKLYNELNLKFLPVFLFDKSVEEGEGYSNVQMYLDKVGDYYSLRIGANYDPKAEVCNDGKDNRDNDGKVDCQDDECKNYWQCMEKKDKPEVQLFVMSHCPFGTQMEKGILPVVELLGNKIDFKVRFVYYAMHGEVEVKEQIRQYCIQKEQSDKYLSYLKCFLEAGETDKCLTQANIDKTKLDTCYEKTDKEFNVMANFNDKTTWLSGRYPLFNIDKQLNEKYGVQGSPTLVVNDVVVETARDPNSLLKTICTGFKEQPSECDKQLPTTGFSAGFGYNEADTNTLAGCGV
ncbi:MAG: hypothetical protein QXE31_01705 [Candidatus Woesearchaeota archaeon]